MNWKYLCNDEQTVANKLKTRQSLRGSQLEFHVVSCSIVTTSKFRLSKFNKQTLLLQEINIAGSVTFYLVDFFMSDT